MRRLLSRQGQSLVQAARELKGLTMSPVSLFAGQTWDGVCQRQPGGYEAWVES